MRVTKITIGRLFNLGSYEHVRYDLTVELSEGDSATLALTGMEKIIGHLNPKRPANVPDAGEMAREASRICGMKALSDEDFKNQHLGSFSITTREEFTGSKEKQLAESVARADAWEARSKKARQLLDDLGGAAHFKDAKLSWDDDQEF